MDATPHTTPDPDVVAYAEHVLDLYGEPADGSATGGPYLPQGYGASPSEAGTVPPPPYPAPGPEGTSGGTPAAGAPALGAPPQGAPAPGPPPQGVPAPPPRRRPGPLRRLWDSVRDPETVRARGRQRPYGENASQARRDLTRSLESYRTEPSNDHHLELLHDISRSLHEHLRVQAEAAQEQRDQAHQAQRDSTVSRRIALASMVFGAAGWIVALSQLLLDAFG
ncbi:hypothetical protein FHX37_2977 [Haloactinospora alba]|uniref:Uncharacterized protein n=1 Tax=Haloactinospora alba TaxID=405555 RepID=A0A543NMC9_9ACTN|nr:hypothetical protein [Haloactinospora alba]TQN32985.1 hypothetical protein FHX37_2977 [Haloactinospora alba]